MTSSAFRIPQDQNPNFWEKSILDKIYIKYSYGVNYLEENISITGIIIYCMYIMYCKKIDFVPLEFEDFREKMSESGSIIYKNNIRFNKEIVDILLEMNIDMLAQLLSKNLDYGRTKKGNSKSRDLTFVRENGIFYTPYFISEHALKMFLDEWKEDFPPTICDPSIGGGNLIIPAIKVLLTRYPMEDIFLNIYGVDIDNIAIESTSIAIAAICSQWDIENNITAINPRIICGDSYGGFITSFNSDNFVWSFRFPHIFNKDNPGFDIVITNPPYGRYKIDNSIQTAKQFNISDNELIELKERSIKYSHNFKNHPDYRFSSKGIIDRSRIGLERAMSITKNGGFLAAIIPSTICADDSSFMLRRELLLNWKVKEISEIPEDAKLFYEVNQSLVLILARSGAPTKEIKIIHNVYGLNDIETSKYSIWSLDSIKELSKKCAIPLKEFNGRSIIKKLGKHPILGDNHAIINVRGEIDITIHSESITDDCTQTPLVRGDQLHCFRSDLSTDKPGYIIKDQAIRKISGSPKLSHLNYKRIAGRQCSYLYKRQRLIFSEIEKGKMVGNSCNYLIVPEDLFYYVLGLLNSRLYNWRFKLTNSNNHVSNSEISEFPLPEITIHNRSIIDKIKTLAESLSKHYTKEKRMILDSTIYELFGLSKEEISIVEKSEGEYDES